VRPPQILLTTPESLSLLLSYPDSFTLFENLRTIVVDELHGFAKDKRGDLLSLSLGADFRSSRQAFVALDCPATISDPGRLPKLARSRRRTSDAGRGVAGRPGRRATSLDPDPREARSRGAAIPAATPVREVHGA
jgi:Lhr-like helicase